MIARGRTVLQGEVVTLRASAGGRQLRLHVETSSRDWLATTAPRPRPRPKGPSGGSYPRTDLDAHGSSICSNPVYRGLGTWRGKPGQVQHASADVIPDRDPARSFPRRPEPRRHAGAGRQRRALRSRGRRGTPVRARERPRRGGGRRRRTAGPATARARLAAGQARRTSRQRRSGSGPWRRGPWAGLVVERHVAGGHRAHHVRGADGALEDGSDGELPPGDEVFEHGERGPGRSM